MSFPLILVLGAFLLAVWVDARFERLRPATIAWRIAHVAASCLLLQLASIGAGALIPGHDDVLRRLVVVFAALLPVFVYTFVSGLWMLRTLADSAFARR